MEAYIYQSVFLCSDCALPLERGLEDLGMTDNGDSNTYPQGPYSNGGGEADYPQHCASCNKFLENPLTTEGVAYVRAAIAEGTGDVLATWADFYSIFMGESMTDRNGTTMETTITLQRAAQDALPVQDACNLSGVARSFLQAVAAVNEEAHRIGEGTAWRNNHPIIRLYVDKLASLSGMQGPTAEGNYSAAYEECKALAAAEEEEEEETP